MGWIPEGGGTSDHGSLTGLGDNDHPQYLTEAGLNAVVHSRVVELEVVDDAAPRTAYANDRQGWYDPASHRTYIAYLGLERDLYATYYDHHAGTFATPVEVGTYPIDDNNNHGAPSICVSPNGSIHIVWGSHNSVHKYSKSDSAHDISAWTTVDLANAGTYPAIISDTDGDLYVIDRAGSGGHSSPFPSHAYGSLRKSTDNGATWSTHVAIVDTSGAPETHTDFYPIGGTLLHDGRIYFSWTVSRGTSHNDTLTNIYCAYYDISSGDLFSVDGTNLGTSIDWTDHTDCLAATRSPTGRLSLAVKDANRVAITYNGDTNDIFVTVWDGSTWTDTNIGLATPSQDQSRSVIYPTSDGWRGLFAVDNASSGLGDVKLYGSDWAGVEWAEIATILTGDSGEGFSPVSPVHGYGPMVALTAQDPAGWAETSATASDLVTLHAVFETVAPHDHEEYSLVDGTRAFTGTVAGVTPNADADLATKGYVDTVSGVGELLMQDGVTAPPVPIETEARDDWLYEG